MRVSREQAAANRARVVEAAARLFRERGFDGVAVADLMQAAGLTHGGFYGQFESKDALAAEACAKALEGSAGDWRSQAAEKPRRALAGILDGYLAARHRDGPGRGCALAALGSEAAKQSLAVRAAMSRGVEDLAEVLQGLLPGRPAERRRAALAMLATLVGALTLSRAVADRALSDAILAAARDALAR